MVQLYSQQPTATFREFLIGCLVDERKPEFLIQAAILDRYVHLRTPVMIQLLLE